MKNSCLLFIGILTLLLFSGCPKTPDTPDKVPGKFPLNATNFSEVNSQYDDYNSAFPGFQVPFHLVFSSNRDSHGENFDIVDNHISFSWTWGAEVLDLIISKSDLDSLLTRVNTGSNEYGPNILYYDYKNDLGSYNYVSLLMFSNNENSDCYQSKVVYRKYDGEKDTAFYTGPIDVNFANENCNLQYISVKLKGETPNEPYYNGNLQKEYSQVFFQANAEGQTDIFYTDIPENTELLDFLTTEQNSDVFLIEELSSPFEDKCPYVNANLMVFTSDRPGGFGGYDLYFSKYEDGKWSNPINFGERINSAFDEFRPITVYAEGFETDLMIFSSNRPGGKGGFDLYYVGIEKIVPQIISD